MGGADCQQVSFKVMSSTAEEGCAPRHGVRLLAAQALGNHLPVATSMKCTPPSAPAATRHSPVVAAAVAPPASPLPLPVGKSVQDSSGVSSCRCCRQLPCRTSCTQHGGRSGKHQLDVQTKDKWAATPTVASSLQSDALTMSVSQSSAQSTGQLQTPPHQVHHSHTQIMTTLPRPPS